MKKGPQTLLMPEEARACRHSLLSLMIATTRAEYGYKGTPFHRLLCSIYHKILRNEPGFRFVIMSCPPQHGKSETGSRGLPVMCLGLEPRKDIILASYGTEYAAQWGEKIRDTLIEFGPQVFGNTVKYGSRSKTLIIMEKGRGKLHCAGLRGQVTGKGCHRLFIDDPVKNDEEAGSPVYQEKTYRNYCATLRTRVREGGSILLTMTRWNQQDLAGRLIQDMHQGHGEEFTVINLPAIATEDEDWNKWGVDHTRKKGEPLCPEIRSLKELESIRAAIGSYYWNALYQGQPTPDSGNIFFRYWFKSWDYDENPLPVYPDMVIQSWDMSFKDKKTSSYTVGQVWYLKGPNMYLVDQIKGQVRFGQALNMVRRVSQAYPQTCKILIEDKANGTAVMDTLRAEIPCIEDVEPYGSKLARARGVSPIAEFGNMFIPGRGISTLLGGDKWVWVDTMPDGSKGFVEEHVAFPESEFDDQVDAETQATASLRANIYCNVVPDLGTATEASKMIVG